jgi:hypothetical protein
MSAAEQLSQPAFRRVDRGRWHSYTLNGHKVPGVTTLIGDGVPKPALINWSARMVAEHVADHIHDEDELARWLRSGRDSLVGELAGVPSGERDAAGNRGTEVHTLARAMTEGREVEVPEPLVGHVDSYLAFLSAWEPTEELVERPCLNRRHRYAGTFDLLCTLPELGRCLIDVKTARSGIWPETALQLAAYRRAEWYEAPGGRLETMPPVEHTLALWVRADGFDLHPVNTDDDVFRTFLYVADVAQRFAKAPRDSFIQPALPLPEAS